MVELMPKIDVMALPDAGKAPAGFPAGASACRKSRFAPRGAARISRAAVSVGTEPLTRPADGSAS